MEFRCPVLKAFFRSHCRGFSDGFIAFRFCRIVLWCRWLSTLLPALFTAGHKTEFLVSKDYRFQASSGSRPSRRTNVGKEKLRSKLRILVRKLNFIPSSQFSGFNRFLTKFYHEVPKSMIPFERANSHAYTNVTQHTSSNINTKY